MLLRSLGSFTTLHVATCYCHVAKISGIAYYVTLLRSLVWVGVGVGGHVNVPCTSYMIYCHVAKISGIAYYVTTLQVATLLRSLGSFTTLHVATLLRSLGLFTTLQVGTVLKSLGSLTTFDAHDVYLDLSKINRF